MKKEIKIENTAAVWGIGVSVLMLVYGGVGWYYQYIAPNATAGTIAFSVFATLAIGGTVLWCKWVEKKTWGDKGRPSVEEVRELQHQCNMIIMGKREE